MPSWQDKIHQAAIASATEAVQRERARCLYICDRVVKRCEKDLAGKILHEQQRHNAEVKLQIMRALSQQIKQGIVLNIRPPEPISVLRQPVRDQAEMQKRIELLTGLLQELGWTPACTLADVAAEISRLKKLEDRYEEMQDRIEELEGK